MLKAQVIKSRNFDLNFRLTAAHYDAVFVELPKERINGKWLEMIMNGSYAKGVSRGAIYTKKYEGVDPETGWGRWAAYKNENGTSTDTSYIPEPYKYL